MKQTSTLGSSIFESPFLSSHSPLKSNKSTSVDLFSDKKDITATLQEKKKKSKGFSLLDDFESGNTSLNDILLLSPKGERITNRVSDDELFGDCGAHSLSFDFNSYVQSMNLEHRMFGKGADLDYKNLKKITIEQTDNIQAIVNFEINRQEGKKEPIDGLIGNLSLDGLDFQVRSNHYNPMDDYEADEDAELELEDIDFGSELKEFMNSSPDNSRQILDEIFDHEENFDNLEFDNIEETSDGTDNTTDSYEGYTYNEGVKNINHKRHIIQPQSFLRRHEDRLRTNSSLKNSRYKLDGEFYKPSIYTDSNNYRTEQFYNEYTHTSSNITKQLRSPKRVCSPSTTRTVRPQKPNIKTRKNLLNLIVESSDGNLDDATKYATEINSQNCKGIPIPEKITELVTIPTSGPEIGGVRKAAIVKAIHAKSNPLLTNINSKYMNGRIRVLDGGQVNNNKGSSNVKNGFYTKSEQKDFLKRNQHLTHFEIEDDKENKRFKNDDRNTVKIKLNPLNSTSSTANIVHRANGKKTFTFSTGSVSKNSKNVTWDSSLEW